MKAYLIAASAGVLGLVVLAVAMPRPDPVDTLVSGSIQSDSAAAREYSITNVAGKTDCVAERGAAMTSRSRSFAAPAGCDSVWPGLASVRNWTENEDGTVILSDARGEAILTVTEDDGPSYVAVEPAGAAITLMAVK